MKNLFVSLCLSGLFPATALATDFEISGVMNDVSYLSVVNGGWSVLYRGDYSAQAVSISEIFGDLSGSTKVALASIADGSTTFDVIASTTLGDLMTYTYWNQTHESNGALWYWNAYSVGFAGVGDAIYQNSADTEGITERDRLSWHASVLGSYSGLDYNVSPTFIDAGWRTGNVSNLNGSSSWDRVILISAVPEPESYAMLLAGLGMLAAVACRRSKA